MGLDRPHLDGYLHTGSCPACAARAMTTLAIRGSSTSAALIPQRVPVANSRSFKRLRGRLEAAVRMSSISSASFWADSPIAVTWVSAQATLASICSARGWGGDREEGCSRERLPRYNPKLGQLAPAHRQCRARLAQARAQRRQLAGDQEPDRSTAPPDGSFHLPERASASWQHENQVGNAGEHAHPFQRLAAFFSGFDRRPPLAG